MKILLINSPIYWAGRKRPVYPLGLSFVGTFAKNKLGASVDLLDLNLHEGHLSSLKEKLLGDRYDVVGVGLRNGFYYGVPQFGYLSEVVKTARQYQPRAKIVGGGCGFSLWLKEIMEYLPELDFGVFGEGEKKFVDLIESGFSPVEGVAFRDGNGIAYTESHRALPPGDLPIPWREWEGVPLSGYQWLNIQTRRGCIFRCEHCCEPALQGKAMRPFPVARIREEIDYVRALGARRIFFCDTIFNFPLDHAYEVCRGLPDKGTRYSAFLKIGQVNGELLRLLEEKGFERVFVTFESGSDRILEAMKTTITQEDINNAIDIVSGLKRLKVSFSFMMGYPEEGLGDLLQTMKVALRFFMRRPLRNRLQFEPLVLYPHSPLSRKGGKTYPLFAHPSGNHKFDHLYTLASVVQRVSDFSGKVFGKRFVRLEGLQ